MPTLYDILELRSTASSDDIRSAYRRLVKKCHPDVVGDAGAVKFDEINKAYEVLSDKQKKKRYDLMTRSVTTPKIKQSNNGFSGGSIWSTPMHNSGSTVYIHHRPPQQVYSAIAKIAVSPQHASAIHTGTPISFNSSGQAIPGTIYTTNIGIAMDDSDPSGYVMVQISGPITSVPAQPSAFGFSGTKSLTDLQVGTQGVACQIVNIAFLKTKNANGNVVDRARITAHNPTNVAFYQSMDATAKLYFWRKEFNLNHKCFLLRDIILQSNPNVIELDMEEEI